MSSGRSLKDGLSSRWWINIPFLVGLFVLAFIVWITFKTMSYPHDGIGSISQSGVITQIILPNSTSSSLQDGDKIISVDSIPWKDVFAPYKSKRSGEQAKFTVERAGQNIDILVSLVDPPVSEILVRLVPILAALVFWGLAIGVQTFKPNDGAANIFFAWCMVCAITLTAGVGSYLEGLWTSILFGSLLWIIGPLSVHFHLDFPQSNLWKRKKLLLGALYLLAITGIIAYWVTVFFENHSSDGLPSVTPLGRIYLGINLLLVVGLLLYHYTHAGTPGVKAKIRLVALGGGLSGLSIVILTILPDGLFHQPILPYQYTFLLLAIIPLTYGYAIYRYHLIEIDDRVNRGATNFLIYSIIGGSYLVFYAFLRSVLPGEIVASPLINAFILLLLVSMFSPLRVWIQRFVDTIFYGNWYDYRLGVMSLTQDLDVISDLSALAKTVSERLVNTLNLEESCTFFRTPDGNFSIIETATRSNLTTKPSDHNYPVLPRSSLSYLLKIGAVERNSLRKALSDVTITPEELQLLNSEQIHLWVPIIGREQILGLLALGPKLGGDVFSKDDFDIMRVLVRQLGPIIEKIHLLTRLRQHAAELEKRVDERTEELYNSIERVEAILASVGDAVVVTDLNGKIIRANLSYEKQSGYTASEIIGKDFDALIAGKDNANLFTEITASIRDRGLWSSDLVSQRKSGESYDARLIITPVRDQSGQIVSYVNCQLDITRQKELERMKDMFIADVSHELRTPTTNIYLYLELLDVAPPQKKAQYLDILKQQTKQLIKLVEDILDLSRLTREKGLSRDFSKINLNLLIEQLVQSNQPLARVSGIHLRFEAPHQIHSILGDEIQISRLVSNLISNAIRYTKDGEVIISISTSGNFVCLLVRDTGIGIDNTDLPHIFERFYRGQNVRQSTIHGTGLGLSIVKEIVDLHKGRIEVQSEPGKGSTFQVWLPIKEVENA